MQATSGRRRAALLRRTIAIAGGATLATAIVLPASAHAVKTIGPYTLAIGWANEPTYVGFANAVEVIVTDASGKPVQDLQAGALKAQVTIGSQKSDTKDLAPGFDPDTGLGTPGDYNVPLIPTVVGAYTFHITGDVHGTAVDQTITASDKTFAVVTEPSDDQFPVKLPPTAALSTKLTQTGSRVATAQKAADDASSAANRAMVIGVVALVVGVVLGGGGVALAARRRKA